MVINPLHNIQHGPQKQSVSASRILRCKGCRCSEQKEQELQDVLPVHQKSETNPPEPPFDPLIFLQLLERSNQSLIH